MAEKNPAIDNVLTKRITLPIGHIIICHSFKNIGQQSFKDYVNHKDEISGLQRSVINSCSS